VKSRFLSLVDFRADVLGAPNQVGLLPGSLVCHVLPPFAVHYRRKRYRRGGWLTILIRIIFVQD
jgi:hypothetical protein